MARKLPSHLKIHVENDPHSSEAEPQGRFDVAELMDSFTEATGWIAQPIGDTPHTPGGQATCAQTTGDEPKLPLRKRMRLVSTEPIDGMLDVDELGFSQVTSEVTAWRLLEQIDTLVQTVEAAEQVIRRQEAELATSLGVSIRNDESDILASRMNESLHRVAAQTCSDAAALYLLDETTSDLKMRACWGMPAGSLGQPARPLRGALADLEALMGNAVLLENTELAPEWNCPESYAAAMCVPIGSPTMPHGTIWLWSDHVRDFSTNDIDAAKAAADKILSDIERSILADEVLKNRQIARAVDSAGLVQASRLPSNQPLHADYEVAGWTFQGQSLGGCFHTWNINRRQEICAAMGSAATHGAAGAVVAMGVQSVVETCWNAKHIPSQVLRRANDMFWQAADADWRSSLAYLTIHPESGSAQLAMAGNIEAFVVASGGHRLLSGTPTMLSVQPDTSFQDQQLYLEAGELLLFASPDIVAGPERGGFTQDELLQIVGAMQDEPVQEIVDHLARKLPLLDADGQWDIDRSLMLLRRRF